MEGTDMNRAAATTEWTDGSCNWQDPFGGDSGKRCGQPAVQHFDARMKGRIRRFFRCADHKLPVELIGKIQMGTRT